MLPIEWMNQKWLLLPEKAMYWPAKRAAIVADLHFGKAAAFRHHGLPVPSGTTEHDLARLSQVIGNCRCEQLIILGDFLHARDGRAGRTMSLIEAWREAHPDLVITLVRGNHDRHAGDPPCEWNFQCVDEPHVLGNIALHHIHIAGAIASSREICSRTQSRSGGVAGRRASPQSVSSRAVIAGHVHPCVRLHDSDGSSLRAPCFVFNERCALLPAFGSFTGTHPIRPRIGDRVYAVGPDAVIAVRTRSRAAKARAS